MNDAVLRLEQIAKTFAQGPRRLEVLKGIDLTVRRGECLAIVGPSGAGKSTLLHIACGLMRPSAGGVILEDKRLSDLSDLELSQVRNQRVGFIFQLHHLMPEFSAWENVALPALIAGAGHAQALARARELLDQVGLAERGTHRPGELSGGEQQRVAIARALINSPALLLADEPTGDLDAATAEGIHAVLQRLNREQGQTLVIVTHNPELSRLANRIITLRDGQIENAG
jgi:lipoprotein-releasing system ATP-binding protein